MRVINLMILFIRAVIPVPRDGFASGPQAWLLVFWERVGRLWQRMENVAFGFKSLELNNWIWVRHHRREEICVIDANLAKSFGGEPL